MGYLIGQIIICLLLAAFIGAFIGWFLRGVKCDAREKELLGDLEQTRTRLDMADEDFRVKEAAIVELREEHDSQTQKLQARIDELNPLVETVKEHEETIARLKNDLSDASDLSNENEAEMKDLRAHIATLEPLQGELEKSQANDDRLQNELKTVMAKMETESQQYKAQLASIVSEKDDEIGRIQSELDQLADLRTELAERDTTIERLESQLLTQAEVKDAEIKRLDTAKNESEQEVEALTVQVGEIEELKRKLAEQDSTMSRLTASGASAKLQAEDRLKELQQKLIRAETSIEKRNETIEELRNQLAELEARYKALRSLPAEQLFVRPKETDDLKKIWGIGPVLEKTLNRIGISTFAQIGRFTEEDIERISNVLEEFQGRIVRDGWVEGAKKEYFKKYGQKLNNPT